MHIKIDEEIRSLIPEPSIEERDQLSENISQAGEIFEPLIVWKEFGILLDGHTRKDISDETGIGFKTKEISLPSRRAAMIWVCQNQIGRRNLNDYQRSQMGLKLKPMLEAEATERMKGGVKLANSPPNRSPASSSTRANLPEGRTNDSVASAAGVSRKTIEKVEAIEEKAAEPIRKMAESGEVSIDAAAKVATLPKKKQSKIAAAGPAAVKKAAKAIREGKADAPVLDKFGDPVTDPAIVEAFKNADRFDQALNLLTQVMKIVNPLMGDPKSGEKPIPGGEYVATHRQEFEMFIKNARNILTFGRPHGPCPYPHNRLKCECCGGLGYAVYMSWHNLPPEYLKATQGKNGKAVHG